jgi:hypothetical protein
MTPIHDTYQLKMRDGKIIFVEITITEADKDTSPGYAGYQRLVMERIFKSVKESGYAAKDIEIFMPINSTDPAARDAIKASGNAMERLKEFFKKGGDQPDKE